ncbi:anoctamin-9 [Pteropus medius]|uniref:anoctamin-9 n=1 Tax=Pteropus vampyrus TaxID=132908 RepID=UPI00196A2990|nr:anoctamin-9 [Pteropus giganteus]
MQSQLGILAPLGLAPGSSDDPTSPAGLCWGGGEAWNGLGVAGKAAPGLAEGQAAGYLPCPMVPAPAGCVHSHDVPPTRAAHKAGCFLMAGLPQRRGMGHSVSALGAHCCSFGTPLHVLSPLVPLCLAQELLCCGNELVLLFAPLQGEDSFRILVGTEGDSIPLMEVSASETEAPEPWDYVLVADHRTQRSPRCVRQQQRFLEDLKRKGFRYKVKEDEEKVFFGVQADSRIFDLYRMLLMEPEGPAPRVESAGTTLIPTTTRIRIINFVLNSKTADGDTFHDLVKEKVFETKFPLHKGEEGLKKKWARWRNMVREQPIDDIRNYFGEKVALYFAWLGWYTYMLVPAAVVGLIIFLSGFSLFHASQISKEICEAHDILMCPRGDHRRRYQRLSDTCTFAKLTHLFDNEGTVLFAIFMALWATVFLEIWKRQRARVVLHWDLYGWDEDQEEVALELINCPDYKLRPHQHSYLRSTIILILSLFMICLMIGMAHVLVVYRVLAAAVFSNLALPFLEEQVTTAVVVTGALVHYVTILFMTKINKSVALKLCDFEKPRTFSERESKFTVKFFTLQFFTHFSSLVYVAFILGRINGHPGKSVRLAGLWKLEECHLSGCMMDLFVQMAIIMGLKQTLSNCMEYLRPWLALKYRSMRGHESRDPELRDWQRNYRLNPVNTFSLFDEFMEMMIQYGFTTIFVAAFPLAPLLALFSNLVEIRLDAIKMVRLQRRLVPRKAKDIGTWLQVLETIGVLAVIANGMVIAFTSEFIPRVVYKYRYGPCREGARPAVDCLTGYINHSLSVFHTKDFQDPVKTEDSEHVTECRYRDYRNALDYNFSEQFWILLAIRLAFLILFEHVALCIKLVAAWFVPDVPQSVKNRVLEEKYRSLREKLGSSPKSTDV